MTAACSLRCLTAQQLQLIEPILTGSFDPKYNESWRESDIEHALSIVGTTLVIAEDAHKCLGFSLCRVIKPECELLLLAVAPSARRNGVGSALINQAMAAGKHRGATKMFLEVRATNEARNFYAHHHFSVIGHRKQYYRDKDGQTVDAITMCIDII